ncbi:hypothetical protein FB451DRAFT_1390292 [Mycena latifolia]|nr:hypothetical protein FB451DRAFT_1390292 [Mycena latifolia]
MHLPLTLLAVVALCLDLSAEASRTPRAPRRPRAADLTGDPPLPSTNAKRLQLGLPLLPPRRRAPTPRGSAPRSEPSPGVLITRTYNLAATVMGTSQFLGYVSASVNSFGVYGAFQSTQGGALQVTFTYSGLAHTALSLSTPNGLNMAYPFFGATLGAPDNSYYLSTDNYVGAFLGGTTQVSAGPPVMGSSTVLPSGWSESAIWTYDSTSRVLTPKWTNADGSSPPTTVILWNPADNTMNLFGNPSVVNLDSALRLVTLTCVDLV